MSEPEKETATETKIPDKVDQLAVKFVRGYNEICYDPEELGEPANPLEQKISMGNIGAYGSYWNALPVYNTEELKPYYFELKEYAKWAIENKVCVICRFPWSRMQGDSCECGHYKTNKERIDKAICYAMKILAYDQMKMVELAKRWEADLADENSEYAQLNRKAHEIMGRVIARKNREYLPPLYIRIFYKRTWKYWLRRFFSFFTPSYWKYTRGGSKSIPLANATIDTLKEMSYDGKSTGNCFVRTQGGCVVVVPVGFLDANRDKYKGASVVVPAIKG